MIYDFVFVVLVYRNTNDLKDFFKSLHIPKTKVMVVNSYYDKKSEEDFERIAKANNADFISIPNKGYGAGNNRGCEYALNHYNFKYLIISNADVEIEKMCLDDLDETKITAPDIINRRGKRQNPAKAFNWAFTEWLIYKSFKNNKPILLWINLVITKLLRELFYLMNSVFGMSKIYEVHGAFIIIPQEILKRMYPLFNEDMFLYAEEDHLARLAKKYGIEKIYNKKIRIRHKEDGSVSYSSSSQLDFVKESYVTYYESWKNGKY